MNAALEQNTQLEVISARSVAGHICRTLNPEAQTGKLLIHLLRYGAITQLEANELYRIHRLASRINDLKNLGVTIQRSTLTDPTGVRYVRYALN